MDKRVDVGRQTALGLTCTLLQLDAAAHVDVVYPDVSSGRVVEEPFEHHLDRRR